MIDQFTRFLREEITIRNWQWDGGWQLSPHQVCIDPRATNAVQNETGPDEPPTTFFRCSVYREIGRYINVIQVEEADESVTTA